MTMEDEPTLQNVLDLGGTEEDFALLQEEDGGSEVENISQNEISNFISKIGLIPGQWMDDFKEDESEEDNNREDKNKIKDKDQLKTKKRVDVKNDEDDKIQQGIKRDETENVAIMKLTSTKKQANEKLKLHPQLKLRPQQQQVPSHETSSLTTTKKKKKSQNLSETTPIQTTQLDLSPDQSLPTQFNSLLDPLSLNKILPASDTEDLTKLSSMGVVELVAATQDLEEKLLQLSATEHTKIYIPLDNGVPWFEDSNSEIGTMLVSQEVQNHLHTLAGQVMTSEVKLYQKTREKRKGQHDVQWLKTILTSGTLSDKMAAMTLIVQESPVHSLSTIENFISMSSKRSKRESILAIDTFKGLVISDILPENRKLKYLKQRPLEKLLIMRGQGEMSCDQHKLLLWYFEDRLKDKYFRYVTLLKELLHDPVSEIREKITGVVFDLLYNRPEQEQLLLKLIVNKLGDPNRRIASKSILLLLKLLNHHVNMKLVVVREIEKLLHRPNVQPKTQYYTICFLNQIVIGPSDQLLPQKLIGIYFSFFKTYIDKSEFDSKILSALLTGVNRALPYLKVDVPSLEDHLNSLFKIVHVGPLATSVQSLALLYQVMEKRQAVSSRYYRALYQKLMDTQLRLRTGQQAMFLNLLYKSLKSDPELNRNKAFLKRILQSCDYHMPHFVCGCLLIISEVLKTKPALWAYILQPEIGNEEEIFHDVDETEEEEEAITMEETTAIEDIVEGYRMKHREPLYCRAEISCLWELARLTHHFHPSVQVFANKIASGNPITYDGDPLNDFTAIQFLDHFVHKNPKQKVSDHGGSVMQPIGNLLKTEVYTLPRSMSDLATMDEEKVRKDLLFIHKFMKRDFEMNRLKYDETIKKKRRRKKVTSLSDEEEEEKKETSDNDNNNEDNPDFAGEFTKQVKIKQEQKIKEKRKKKSARDSVDNDEDFSYSDMSSSDFEEDHDISVDNSSEDDDNKVEHFTTKEDVEEAHLEKMLLENLSSSSEDETETSISRKRGRENEFDSDRKKKKMDHSSVFASADEFAYLLEESEEKPTTFLKKKKTGAKEQGWEEKRASGYHGWSQIKRDFRGKSYRRGTSRGGFRGRVKGLTGEKIQGSGGGGFRGGSRERGGGGFRGGSRERGGEGFRGASREHGRGGFRGASRGRGGGGFRGGSCERGRGGFRGASHGRGGEGFRGASREHGRGGFRGASRGRGGGGFRGASRGRGGGGFRGASRGRGGGGFRGGSRGRGGGGFRGASRGRGGGGFRGGSRGHGGGGFRGGSRGRGGIGFRGGTHGSDNKGPRGHSHRFRGGSRGPGEKRGFRGRGESGFSRGSHGGFKRGLRGRGRV